MRHLTEIVSVLLVAGLLAACSNPAPWSDQDTSNAAVVWLNQVGLNQTDEDVWSDRLDALCDIDPVYINLAERYIAQDAEYSVRSDGELPTSEEGRESLYTIRLQTCGPQR